MKTQKQRVAIGLVAIAAVAVISISGASMAAISESMEALNEETKLTESEAAAEVERVEAETAPLGDASDEVDAYLRASGWEGFSVTAIKDQKIVVRGVDQIPDDVLRKATDLAGDFPLVVERVSFTQDEYVKATDALVERLGEERTHLKYVSMPENKKIRIEILTSDRTAEIERIVREVLNGFPLEIVYAPEDDPGPQPLVNRWNDTVSPLTGGAFIETTILGELSGCTSGFSARRNSNDAKVMITAWHCNGLVSNTLPGVYANRVWSNHGSTYGLGSANTSIGYPSGSSNIVDGMFLQVPAGKTFGSRIYVGGYQASNTKLRKGSGNPKEGDTLTASGAFSGGSTGVVKNTMTLVHGSVGRGFDWESNNGRSIGGGDSGGPVHRAHTDGTYSARGIVSYALDYPPDYCSQGMPGRGAVCSKRMFAMNIETIEAKLDVTVYPS